jgi:hypothetical protein
MRVTQNTADFLFMQGANGDDPIVRYALVGKTVEEGLFAWIRFGVNTQANKPVSPAAWWTENGGVMNPNGPVVVAVASPAVASLGGPVERRRRGRRLRRRLRRSGRLRRIPSKRGVEE